LLLFRLWRWSRRFLEAIVKVTKISVIDVAASLFKVVKLIPEVVIISSTLWALKVETQGGAPHGRRRRFPPELW
jgi:hypothetical protein